jgi:hypothetical protein
MKTNNGNQGEGDKASARRYNQHAEEFVSDGRVNKAAADAREFVEAEPEEAQAAERAGKRGPSGTKVSLDDLMAKGRTVVDRVRPMIERAADKVRAAFKK